ncbi:hypothetical protein ACA758_00485 [Mycoplasmopsis agassizii]|uniref:hypothetical protein n=1 Tax=Mycoplasmopsis agassizii TaxID=33922 RepID=UPI003527756E
MKKVRALEQEYKNPAPRQKAQIIKWLVEKYSDLSVSVFLKAVNFPKSTYYYEISKDDIDDKNQEIIEEIKKVLLEHRGNYGIKKIAEALKNVDLLLITKSRTFNQKFNLKPKVAKEKIQLISRWRRHCCWKYNKSWF